MPKAPKDFAARCRAVGLWGEFIDYRRQQMDMGVPPDLALQRALAEFTPRVADAERGAATAGVMATAEGRLNENPPSPSFASEVDMTLDLAQAKGEGKLTESALWVSRFLHVDGVRPCDAPSAQAWNMLVWARRSEANESTFYVQVLAKLMPSRSQITEDVVTDEGIEEELIGARLEELGGQKELTRGKLDIGSAETVPPYTVGRLARGSG